NIDISTLYLRIGPSICKHCFEFGSDGSDPYNYFLENCISKNDHGLRNIDTRTMLIQQALEAGVNSEYINQDTRCTVEDLELCSRRRENIVGKNNYAWIEIT
ncbi:MAG: Multi-copper polyphenol oxidoreductase laccase, partial [Candidatus Parcubacteria bacterium]